MVPLRLRLHNFMCYRDPADPLALDGVHIACLTGDNGHGKSALLDAITWALWGKSRADSDDDLIHLGQSEMEVELTFRLGETSHRVIRKRARPRTARGAGTTTLELQVLDGDGNVMPITGGTVRETQQKITDLLRMDYDTFTNSAFLLQGRADAFTVKSPGERKKVLGDILGLALYEQLEERARAASREAENRAAQLTRELAGLDDELQVRDQIALELDSARNEAARLAGEAARVQETVDALRSQQHSLELLAQQATELRQRVAGHRANAERFHAEAATHATKIQELLITVARREDILAGGEELRHIGAVLEDDRTRQARALQLQVEISTLTAQIAKDETDLAAEIKVLDARLEQQRQRASRLSDLDDEFAGLGHQEDQLAQRQREIDELTDDLTQRRGRVAYLKEENGRLRNEMETLRLKRDQIAGLDDDALCPLCGTRLGLDGRDHITAQYNEQGAALRDQYRGNEGEQKSAAADLKNIETDVANRRNLLTRERGQFEQRRANITKERSDAINAQSQLAKEQPRIDAKRRQLEQQDFAQDERAKLAQLTAELVNLRYDEEAHRAHQQRFEQVRHYDDLGRRLQLAEQGLATEQAAKARADELAAQAEAALQEDGARLDELERELTGADEVRAHLLVATSELSQLSERLARRQQEVGALTEKHDHLTKLAAERVETAAELDEARREANAFSDLVTAFGRRGIQALLIEQALPELEELANELLGRMTNNRMSVKMEATRQTQRGTEVETLDIKISDELGTRDYDLFSGGEAFRINFALRVALSKLLAHRAGAPLPTLILDEGFGSQDSAGREKLVEVLNAIQDDFECILVITHIEELKEVFPVRIEVVKAAQGSDYRMMV